MGTHSTRSNDDEILDKVDQILRKIYGREDDGYGRSDSSKADRTPAIPLIDPTANVSKLVELEIKHQNEVRTITERRQDNLREQEVRYHERINSIREGFQEKLAEVRENCGKELTLAESSRINAITLAESRRVDALLAASTAAVALASEKNSAAAATLATQVTASAETLRAQVATTALSGTQLITQLADALNKRLTLVEQNQYLGVGGKEQRAETKVDRNSIIGFAIGIAGLLIALSVWFHPN